MKKSILLLALFGGLMACQSLEVAPTADTQAARVDATATPPFSTGQSQGTIKDASLDEVSGIAMSRANTLGYVWVHEDSGGPNKVFLLNQTGSTVANYTLSGTFNRDWEDIAIGPGPVANTNYLYVAEIGDNLKIFSTYAVYRFAEPNIVGKTLPYSGTVTVERLQFRYPDSKPRNAETLMVDPLTKDLYVVSKETGSNANVYRMAYPQSTSSVNVLTLLGSINVPTAVGGDISADGTEVLIKSIGNVYYWKKSNAQQSLWALLQTTSITLPYVAEPQGEAIAWAKNGTGYYTTSEKANNVTPVLYFYKRN
ncbi:MAG: hypothetical protein U0Y10_10245 [Spirosomataceae bacterium]